MWIWLSNSDEIIFHRIMSYVKCVLLWHFTSKRPLVLIGFPFPISPVLQQLYERVDRMRELSFQRATGSVVVAFPPLNSQAKDPNLNKLKIETWSELWSRVRVSPTIAFVPRGVPGRGHSLVACSQKSVRISILRPTSGKRGRREERVVAVARLLRQGLQKW